MRMDVNSLLVYHCAPTMAGLKMASLVCLPMTEDESIHQDMVAHYNHQFNRKGLYFRTLCSCRGRHLLYLYRKEQVDHYLEQSDVQAFLKTCGYTSLEDWDSVLSCLSFRLRSSENFPHEIGVFLGYPLEDVKSFIKEQGANAKLCGEWKVYHDVEFAACEFARYACCRKQYVTLYNRGYAMEYLVIA